MKIAGLDIGTTGCKCTVFDESGKYLGKTYRDYPVKRAVGGHEIDVSALMDGVYAAIREMAERYPDIAGIGVTSFGETFVLADGAGRPLYPALLYTDPRGAEECEALRQKLGAKHIAEITGLNPHEMYSLPKIMWISNHCPEVYAKTERIFLMEDYVVYHLTGNAYMDYSLATRTMAFDIRNLCWSRELFEAAEVDRKLMSELIPAGSVAGTLTKDAATRTGLQPDTKVITSSHDQIAAAVGAGAFDATVAVDGAGTVECLTPIYDSIPDINAMYAGSFAVVPHVVPGKYAAYAFSYTGGALVQWCVDHIAKKEKESAAAFGISANEYLEREYRKKRGGDRPGNILVLPHFAGAATPYMDTGSRGCILGLTTDTTAADIYRGCMEGVVYEMYLNYQTLKPSGLKFEKIHATGGGARSAVWMQMKADILDMPIVALKTVDAGTVGSAMLTGIAIGVYSDLTDAAAHMVEEEITYLPRPAMHDAYMENFEKYRQLYRVVRPLVID